MGCNSVMLLRENTMLFVLSGLFPHSIRRLKRHMMIAKPHAPSAERRGRNVSFGAQGSIGEFMGLQFFLPTACKFSSLGCRKALFAEIADYAGIEAVA